MERDAEIEQIARELAILRSRYALYLRTAGIVKGFSIVLAPILAIAGLTFAVRLFMFDALYGLFAVGASLCFGLIVAWYIKSANLRWIDIACPQIRRIYNPYFYYPDADRGARPRSDAELLEWQIAGRQRRLAELAATAPGTGGPDRSPAP